MSVMMFLFLSCLLLCLTTITVDGANHAPVSPVLELTDTSYASILSNADHTYLVEFYAPWCTHCKQLAPIYEEVAATLAPSSPLQLCKVDCTAYPSICKHHNIEGYPTLKFLRNGVAKEYNYGRTKEDFLRFADAMTRPAVMRLNKASEVEAFTSRNNHFGVTYVLFDDDNLGAKEHAVYKQIATDNQGTQGVHFLRLPLSELKHFDISDSISPNAQAVVVAISRGISKHAAHDSSQGVADAANLRHFVESTRHPLIAEANADTFPYMTNRAINGNRTAFLIIVDPVLESNRDFADRFYSIAERYNKQFAFGIIDGQKYQRFLTQYGFVPLRDFPTVIVIDYPDHYWSPIQWLKARSKEKAPNVAFFYNIDSFLRDVIIGELQPETLRNPYDPRNWVSLAYKWLTGSSWTRDFILQGVGVLFLIGVITLFLKVTGRLDDDTRKPRATLRHGEPSHQSNDVSNSAGVNENNGLRWRKTNPSGT